MSFVLPAGSSAEMAETHRRRRVAFDYLRTFVIVMVVAILFLMPLAIYPAQLQVDEILGQSTSFGEWWLIAARSTAGPLWFVWLQYGVLGVDLDAVLKALLVMIGELILCWGATAALRRIPAVARII